MIILDMTVSIFYLLSSQMNLRQEILSTIFITGSKGWSSQDKEMNLWKKIVETF